MKGDEGETLEPLTDFIGALATLRSSVGPFLKTLAKNAPDAEKGEHRGSPLQELDDAIPLFKADVETFRKTVSDQQAAWRQQKTTNGELKKAVDRLATLAETSRDLVKQTDLLYKLACRLIETCENDGVPEGWERSNVEEIATILKGKNITKDTIEEGNVPVVAGGLKPAYYHNAANASGPVITVSASGANAGHVALYHQDIWASDCSYLSSSDNPEIWFLYLAMKSRQAEISGMQQGAAQPHVYPKHLKRVSLLNPPSTLRKLFHETVEASFLQIANLEKQIEKLAKARDLLLPKLMNGEVAV
ncbi:MAG: restriction endonuclease subunit S [Gammaproteobacteria bacterium]